MAQPAIDLDVLEKLSMLSLTRPVGRIRAVQAGVVHVQGFGDTARIGDRVAIRKRGGGFISGEVVQFDINAVRVLAEGPLDGIALEDRVILAGPIRIAPSDAWLGRVIDPNGEPLDGASLLKGEAPRALQSRPPGAAQRRALGNRLETGLALFNTVLPIVRGQRIGLFAGSGVGKSNLLGRLATRIEADVVVIALIGERGRELGHFLRNILGPEGMAKSVVIAATSDQSALTRRRCAWTAMAVAEHFRDQGKSVLYLADSITRFAEAHREIAVAAGEAPVLRGFPPSTTHMIMSLCERAGPGLEGQGDITGVFSVLVAGSDMEEPIADILRGVLDGHVILSREIAERGRFPAVDVLKSVSRSLPDCATADENALVTAFRRYLSLYERNEAMVSAGLYAGGADRDIDAAIALWPQFEVFSARVDDTSIEDSFARLNLLFRKVASAGGTPPI